MLLKGENITNWYYFKKQRVDVTDIFFRKSILLMLLKVKQNINDVTENKKTKYYKLTDVTEIEKA